MVNIQICKSQYPVISLKLSSVIVKYLTFCRECIGLIFTNQNKNQVLLHNRNGQLEQRKEMFLKELMRALSIN